MANENFKIDTDEIRRIARKISSIESDVRSCSDNNVRSMHAEVETNMKGEAANALLEMFDDLSGDIKKIANSLKTVKNALEAYAKEVERVDKELADKIQ